MTKEEAIQIESSQRQHHETMEHQDRAGLNAERFEYNLFFQSRAKLYLDGNQWCVLFGENIQEGIAGFGDTPYKAILDFNRAWNTPIKEICLKKEIQCK